MAVNTAHSSNGIILHHGEYMLLHFNNVNLEITGNNNSIFNGSKKGRIFLTSHRIIFKNKKRRTPLQSFCVPFIAMYNLSLGQPLFRPNYIKGSVHATPDGNFEGAATFKFSFNNGGAILYGQVMMRAASRILENTINERMMRSERVENPPPAYTVPEEDPDKPPTYEESLCDSLPSYEDTVV